MRHILPENRTVPAILRHFLFAALSLIGNGFGIYLTIRANIGVGPWDVFNLGLSNTFGILYGTASILVSLAVLAVDFLLREKIGVDMVLDAILVGKSVDMFSALKAVPLSPSLPCSLLYLFVGLCIMGYTQYLYMRCALGCGPRDTLLVGLKRRCRRIPIGVVSILILCTVTAVGYLLGGPVGLGTLICAFLSGPILQFCFQANHFDATAIRHQSIPETFQVFMKAARGRHKPA